MPSERLLRASELPPGSRMFPRQGSALTGQEIGEAVIRVVTRMLEDEAANLAMVNAAVDVLDEQMARGWWRAPHLTFPQARMQFNVAIDEGQPLVRVWIKLGVQMARDEVTLEMGNLPSRLLSREITLGPSRIPDQMREELGLPLTAHFRLPDGSVVLAELADPTVEEVGETRGWFKGPNYTVPQITHSDPPPPEPVEPPAEIPPAGLVGTPPPAPPPAPPVEKPAPKVAPKLVAGKGGRR